MNAVGKPSTVLSGHPSFFFADGSVDMFEWHCKVPGKKGTDWEGALVPCTLKFGSDFPAQARP